MEVKARLSCVQYLINYTGVVVLQLPFCVRVTYESNYIYIYIYIYHLFNI